MARPKIKDAHSITIRMEQSLYDRLTDFSKVSGQPKTVAIERALKNYIDDYEQMIARAKKSKTE